MSSDSPAPSDPDLVAAIARRLATVEDRIRSAGGSPGSPRVLAVTKTFPVEVARAAVDAGLHDLGESYGQELEAKAPLLERPTARWHMVGGLQRNKVKRIAAHVSLWQSVDRAELVHEIAKRVPGAAILIQVNTTGEPQKSGCEPGQTPALVDLARDSGLDVRGLMTLGPTGGADPAIAFQLLRRLRDQLDLVELSMGMSADLERAVSEGSTMVRVGTGLFGPRPPR